MTFENAQNALDALPDMARRGGLRDLKTYLEARAIEKLDAIEDAATNLLSRNLPIVRIKQVQEAVEE